MNERERKEQTERPYGPRPDEQHRMFFELPTAETEQERVRRTNREDR